MRVRKEGLRVLTELERCILGVIWREGPMSAYGVRAHFAGSTTVTWSSSTGTVYPAIRRLRSAGLVHAQPPIGPRRTETLTLTDSGEVALRLWLTDVPPALGAATADPIRTRVQFIAALDKPARNRAFADYRHATRATIAVLERSSLREPTNVEDWSERLGDLGALVETRARLRWLDIAEKEFARLENELAAGSGVVLLADVDRDDRGVEDAE